MFRKGIISLIFCIMASMTLFFSVNIDIFASDNKCIVYVDYNTSEISKYLPENVANHLQNYSLSVDKGEVIDRPPRTETINCYYKCSWTIDGELVDLNNYYVDKNVTIVAKWTPIEYTIYYNYIFNEESEITNLQTTQKYTIEDGRINYYRPNRKHYVFQDWYTSSSLNDQFLAIYKTDYSIGPIYLYAKWCPIEYTINYNTDAHNIDNIPTYNVERKYIDLADASKEGYTFDGWYLDKEYKQKVTRIDGSIGGNINLYPKFSAKNCKVTFVLPDGNKMEVLCDYGSKCNKPKFDNNIFEIIKLDSSISSVTEDIVVNVEYVNIWYIYLIGLVFFVALVLIVILCFLKKKSGVHKLRYVYNSVNKNNRRWR